MFKKTVARVAAVSVVAAALISGSAIAAHAASTSAGPFYLVDSGDGTAIAAGTTLSWTRDVSGNPTADNQAFDKVFTGPSTSTGVLPFISPVGDEGDKTKWSAFGFGAFSDSAAKTVLLSPAMLSGMTEGVLGANGVKAAGGTYSLGMAFLDANGKPDASALYFTQITVTAGSGDWTFVTPTSTPPVDPTSSTFDVTLNAQTVAGVDGTLNLVAPASATATIGNPTLVNNLSTSTGTLGEFRVEDGRVVTHPGWTLNTTVQDFVKQGDASKVINKKQLGIAPQLVDAASAPGVTVANPQIAGSAVYPTIFAQAGNTAAVASTRLNANLTFVSPGDMPAGTYVSKMTVTLVSK